MSSAANGVVCVMDAEALGRWADGSAYVSGDEVVVESWACPGMGDVQVAIDHIATGGWGADALRFILDRCWSILGFRVAVVAPPLVGGAPANRSSPTRGDATQNRSLL